MVDVQLSYNAYQNSMRIYADGQPLNNISSLTKYQSMPFLAWCGEILPKLAQEVNDEYALTYIGRSCESRILAALSAEYSYCRSFRPLSPTLADSTTKRLRKLHQLCISGLSYSQFSETLQVYSDLPEEVLSDFFKGVFPRLCFCKMRTQYNPLSSLSTATTDEIRFVIAYEHDESNILSYSNVRNKETYVLLLSKENSFVGMSDSCIIEKATDDAISTLIHQYLELSFFMSVLRKALSNTSIDEGNVNYPSFSCLDKTEPQTYARLPKMVETGSSVPIQLYTVPEGYPTSQVQYRVSNTDIIQIRNDSLYAAGTGEAIVEVYQAGQSVCIARAKIVAHKRNRITSMRVKPDPLRMCVGDKQKLLIEYEPKDADNTSSIRYRSDDGLVASAIDGIITARKPGRTVIRASTDDNVTASCSVKVYPKLESLSMSLSQTQLAHNGIADVTVKRIPDDATLDELIFSVQPSGIAVFDKHAMKLAARASGTGKLIVMDKRKSVQSEVLFEIKPEGIDMGPMIKVVLGAAIVLGLIYVFTR